MTNNYHPLIYKRGGFTALIAIFLFLTIQSDSEQFIQGRTKNSICAIYQGYRYTRDGKLTLANKQRWRCVLKTCKGRIYTVDEELPTSSCTTTQPHDHDSDLADCNAKATVSSIKQFSATTRTPNDLIYAQATGSLSQASDYDYLLLLPVKKLPREPEGRLTLVLGPRLP